MESDGNFRSWEEGRPVEVCTWKVYQHAATHYLLLMTPPWHTMCHSPTETWPWAGISDTMSQKETFFPLKCFSRLSCHSNGKLEQDGPQRCSISEYLWIFIMTYLGDRTQVSTCNMFHVHLLHLDRFAQYFNVSAWSSPFGFHVTAQKVSDLWLLRFVILSMCRSLYYTKVLIDV